MERQFLVGVFMCLLENVDTEKGISKFVVSYIKRTGVQPTGKAWLMDGDFSST